MNTLSFSRYVTIALFFNIYITSYSYHLNHNPSYHHIHKCIQSSISTFKLFESKQDIDENEVSSIHSNGNIQITTESWKAPVHEINRRRNFAIISHPDAGKTTLTEKLLLFGGAIQGTYTFYNKYVYMLHLAY